MNKGKKWWYLLIILTFILYLLSLRPVVVGFAYPLEKDYLNRDSKIIQDIDYVIILGGGAKKAMFDGKTYPTCATFNRLMYGVHIF